MGAFDLINMHNMEEQRYIPKMQSPRMMRKSVSKGTDLSLYNSFIQPIFDFDDLLYGPLSKEDADELQVLHNSCLRICLNGT